MDANKKPSDPNRILRLSFNILENKALRFIANQNNLHIYSALLLS